ncbi:MAG: hypothetical protein K8R59_17960 [Thermoanaerobaculales bacterium]|nr:hypothetical protein [Thermoanaerobaculales bacterium]
MPVLDRVWKRWKGTATSIHGRFFVITRFALADAFASRTFLAFYVLCFLPSLIALLAVYLSHNTAILEQASAIQDWLIEIPEWIFHHLFGWQAMPAFLIAVVVAPSLIAADMGHNALAVVLSRPITRREYILGKLTVLLVLLSPLTWVPALALFGLQASLANGSWGVTNLRIAAAYLIGHWIWMLVISLLGLAVSATVRFATLARGAILAIFLVSAVAGGIINQLTRSSLGDLLHLPKAVTSVVMGLFGAPTPSDLPIMFNWATLIVAALLSLWVLNRRLRACEEIA